MSMEKPLTMADLREMDEDTSLSHSSDMHQSKEVMDSHPRDWSSTRKTLLFVSLMSSSLLADGYRPAYIAFPVCARLSITDCRSVQWSGDPR